MITVINTDKKSTNVDEIIRRLSPIFNCTCDDGDRLDHADLYCGGHQRVLTHSVDVEEYVHVSDVQPWLTPLKTVEGSSRVSGVWPVEVVSGLAAGDEHVQCHAGSHVVPCRNATRVSVTAEEAEWTVQETSVSACNELLMTNDEGDRLKLTTPTDGEDVHDSACPISEPNEVVS